MRIVISLLLSSAVHALYSYQVLPETFFSAAPVGKANECQHQVRCPDMATARQMRVREMIARRAVEEADFFHNLSPHDELLNTLYVIRHRPHDIADSMALDVPSGLSESVPSVDRLSQHSDAFQSDAGHLSFGTGETYSQGQFANSDGPSELPSGIGSGTASFTDECTDDYSSGDSHGSSYDGRVYDEYHGDQSIFYDDLAHLLDNLY